MTNDFYAVSQLVAEFQDKLKVIVERDGSRHLMDAHIDIHTMGLLEDELLPVLEQVIASIEYEPSDEEMGGCLRSPWLRCTRLLMLSTWPSTTEQI